MGAWKCLVGPIVAPLSVLYKGARLGYRWATESRPPRVPPTQDEEIPDRNDREGPPAPNGGRHPRDDPVQDPPAPGRGPANRGRANPLPERFPVRNPARPREEERA